MTESNDRDDAPKLQYIGSDDIEFMSRAMRGVKSARVRFYDAEKGFREEITALLLALDVSVKSENIGKMSPAPYGRYSIQYAAKSATITVSQHKPLQG